MAGHSLRSISNAGKSRNIREIFEVRFRGNIPTEASDIVPNMGPEKISTVIFDLGGVYFTDGAKRFVQKMEELYGVSKEKVEEIIGGKLGKR